MTAGKHGGVFGAARSVVSSIAISACIALLTSLILNSSVFAQDSKEYDSLVKLGQSHLEGLRPEKAVQDLSAAVKLEPKNATAYIYRSFCYRDLRDRKKELADLSQAISLAKMPNFFCLRAEHYVRYKQYKEAVADYTEAIKLSPKDFKIVMARALVYKDMSENRLSIKDYEHSLTLMGNHAARLEPIILHHLGELHMKCKEYPQALANFSLLVKRYPDLVTGYYGRADLYKALGKTALAKADIDKAHAIESDLDTDAK